MKIPICKILAAAVAVILAACAANAAVTGAWGDFSVLDRADAIGARLFGTGPNPPPFPGPHLVADPGNVNQYPYLSETLTVGQFRLYLASRSCPVGGLKLLVRTAPGKEAIANAMAVAIDQSVVAVAHRPLRMFPNALYCFDSNLDLSDYRDDDIITIGLTLGRGGGNVESVDFAVTELEHLPEPISVAFLATGFLGLVAYRLKRMRS